jgi:putative transposase
MIDRTHPTLPVTRQCRILNVSRATVYRHPATAVSDADLELMALIDRQYLIRPFYGSRRMAAWLNTQGHAVNRKRVQRLMRLMGLVAIYQRPNTSKAAAEHIKYPYLLGGLTIDRVNQVWCADITYIPMPRGFLYLVVIMDAVRFCPGACPTPCTPTSVSRRWRRRCEGGRRSSTPSDSAPPVRALARAQGSPFTSDDFIGVLKKSQIKISGKGRCMDNVFVERLWRSLKYEEVYLHAYASVSEAKSGIGAWLHFYNEERPHQTHDYRTPRQVYETGGYVDDRLRRPAAPSTTYPPAQPSARGSIMTDQKVS